MGDSNFEFECIAHLGSLLRSREPVSEEQLKQAINQIRVFVGSKNSSVLTKPDRAVFRQNGIKLFHLAFQEKQLSEEQVAEVRAQACLLIELSLQGIPESKWPETDFGLVIKSAMRSAKAFFDIQAENNSELKKKADLGAKYFFNKALQFWNKAKEVHKDFSKQQPEVGFTFCNWLAKWQSSIGQEEKAYSSLASTLEFLASPKLLPEVDNFSKACYNKGVEAFKRQDLLLAQKYLQLSFEAREVDKKNPDAPAKQARTLRVMSQIFLDTQNFNKALGSIEQSLKLATTIEGLMIKAKLFLKLMRHVEAEEAISSLLQHNNCTMNMGIGICEEAFEAAEKVGMAAYEHLSQRFPNEPAILISKCKIFATKQKFDLAKEMLLEALKAGPPQDADLGADLFNIIWGVAISYFERQEFSKCREWIAVAVMSLKEEDHENRASSMRALALAHFEESNYEESLQAVNKALKLEPSNFLNYVHLLRSQLCLGLAVPEVMQSFAQLIKHGGGSDEIALVAEEANKLKKKEVAILALEQLLANAEKSISAEPYLQPLLILRNLIHLIADKINEAEDRKDESFSSSLQEARDSAELDGESKDGSSQSAKNGKEEAADFPSSDGASSSDQSSAGLWAAKLLAAFGQLRRLIETSRTGKATAPLWSSPEHEEAELEFFAQTAFNNGLHAGEKEDFKTSFELLEHAIFLLSRLPSAGSKASNRASRMKTSAILAAAAMLEQCCRMNEMSEKQGRKALAQRALDFCLQALQSIGQEDDSWPMVKILQFKAKLCLEDDELEYEIERWAQLPQLSGKVLAAAAALCADFKNTKLCAKVLRLSLDRSLGGSTVNYHDVTQYFRSLLMLVQHDQSLPIYDELLKLVSKNAALAEHYTNTAPTEAQWLAADAWNRGVLKSRLRKDKEAEPLMACALQFMEKFGQSKGRTYEKMLEGYDMVRRKLGLI